MHEGRKSKVREIKNIAKRSDEKEIKVRNQFSRFEEWKSCAH
jgi:hypothetical protein